jgi:hypothetical protein
MYFYIVMLRVYFEWNMNLEIVWITKNTQNLWFFINTDAFYMWVSQKVSGMYCFKTLEHYSII